MIFCCVKLGSALLVLGQESSSLFVLSASAPAFVWRFSINSRRQSDSERNRLGCTTVDGTKVIKNTHKFKFALLNRSVQKLRGEFRLTFQPKLLTWMAHKSDK